MSPATWEALAAARTLGETHALTIGAAADGLVEQLGVYGAAIVHQVHHDLLTDYGPEAWGEVGRPSGARAAAHRWCWRAAPIAATR